MLKNRVTSTTQVHKWLKTGNRSFNHAFKSSRMMYSNKVDDDSNDGVMYSPALAQSGIKYAKLLHQDKRDVVVEKKYDGNRLLIKYDKGKIQYLSRSLKEMRNMQPLDDIVKQSVLSSNVSDFIVDCEVYAYDSQAKKPLPFQSLQPQITKLGTPEEITIPVRIAVFDILHRNQVSLIEKPLHDRLKILYETIDLADEITSQEVIHKTEQTLLPASEPIPEKEAKFQQVLAQSVSEGYEGVIMKYLDEPYKPGSRQWYKYKKNYDIADSLDLLCIGAIAGKGKRGQVYGSFLLAAYNETTQQYDTVAKCGTGLTDEQLKLLTEQLAPFVIAEPEANYNVSRPLARTMTAWFKPGTILEITGMEFTQSDAHTSGYSVRFPTFIRVRDDKLIKDVTTVQQIINLANVS